LVVAREYEPSTSTDRAAKPRSWNDPILDPNNHNLDEVGHQYGELKKDQKAGGMTYVNVVILRAGYFDRRQHEAEAR
jgi:hypothetical protein